MLEMKQRYAEEDLGVMGGAQAAQTSALAASPYGAQRWWPCPSFLEICAQRD